MMEPSWITADPLKLGKQEQNLYTLIDWLKRKGQETEVKVKPVLNLEQ